MKFFDNEELTYTLEAEFPDAVYAKDYWVGCEVSPEGVHKCASIYNWTYKGSPEPTKDELFKLRDKHSYFVYSEVVRNKRALLLEEFDHFVNKTFLFNELSEKEKEILSKYRRDLLDISKQEGFPTKVSWPKTPKFIE